MSQSILYIFVFYFKKDQLLLELAEHACYIKPSYLVFSILIVGCLLVVIIY